MKRKGHGEKNIKERGAYGAKNTRREVHTERKVE
jgi:hypothetical protein